MPDAEGRVRSLGRELLDLSFCLWLLVLLVFFVVGHFEDGLIWLLSGALMLFHAAVTVRRSKTTPARTSSPD